MRRRKRQGRSGKVTGTGTKIFRVKAGQGQGPVAGCATGTNVCYLVWLYVRTAAGTCDLLMNVADKT